METLFQKLPVYEPSHDVTGRVMKRIEEHRVATAYRRLVLTMLPFGLSAGALIAYRWSTFFKTRAFAATAADVAGRSMHAFTPFNARSWFEALWVIRQSLPMVETALLAITAAMVGLVFWKLMKLPRMVLWQRSQAS